MDQDEDELDTGPAAALTRPDGWQVVSIDDASVTEPAPTVALDPDGTVSGTTGVNRYRGTYELAESLLEIGPLMTTRMAGPPDAMDVETHFLAILGEPVAVRWDYSTLVLESDAGHLRLEPASDELEPPTPFDLDGTPADPHARAPDVPDWVDDPLPPADLDD